MNTGKSIKSRDEIQLEIQTWQGKGNKVGYTSGVFDLLHSGHLDYLEKAKEVCDRLVVGLNSDQSVQKNKGPTRPIQDEAERARLVRALKPVDEVFIFSELNNQINIEKLRPDVYIKAGDYKKEQLSSAPIIEAYGGCVEIIPLVFSSSTSSIIDNILSKSLSENVPIKSKQKRKVVFLDRDGVINREIGYLHDPKKFELTEGCFEAFQKLSTLDVAIVVVTNQAGIGLGYFDVEDFYKVNQAMFRALNGSGAQIDKIYYCPHAITESCTCRKPKTGMLEKAFEQLNLSKEGSYMIGDQKTDIEAGQKFGVKTIFISEDKKGPLADYTAQNLLEAVEHIIAQG